MNTTLSVLDIIKQKQQEQHNDNSMICDVCQIPLTDPISMDAGKGPVCRTRARFAEKLSRDQLAEIEGVKSPLSDDKLNFRTTILRVKGEENPYLITIVGSVNNDLVFFDRQEYDKAYESNMSVADSLLTSFKTVSKDSCESIASLIEPKNETISSSLKDFHNSYREEIKSREREWKGVGIQVPSRKLLDKDQLEDRKIMMKNYRADNNSKFKAKWSAGEYPIATLMSRLESSTIPGSQELLTVLKSQYGEIKARDFGLTDDEIIHGFKQATLPIERKIFSALIKGKGELNELAQTYKAIKESPKEKPNMEAIKRLNELTS